MHNFFPFFAPADDSSHSPLELGALVRNAQIVIGAVAFGALSFLAVALVVRREGWGPAAAVPNQGAPLLTYTSLAMAVSIAATLAVVPGLMVSAGRKQIARQLPPSVPPAASTVRPQLAALYLRKLIVSAALAEGAAFFAIIALMIEGQGTALVVAGVMIAVVIWQFPSLVSAERWIDDQSQRLLEEPIG